MTGPGKTGLYGSERQSRQHALQLAKTLKSSSVLGAGEYNYTFDKLKSDVWQTSCSRDFPGLGLDRGHTIAAVSQLGEHFRLGNDSGKAVPKAVYKQSTTADDFTQKQISKPSILAEDRTVNWPDMAPQYQADRGIGESEYSNTFTQQNRSLSAPVYPKVKTAIMQLPLYPTRFHVQRGSEYRFGNDEKSKMSEHQRAFGRNDGMEDFSDKLARGETGDVRSRMKALEKQTSVFRTGDYNGPAGNVDSTTVNDFGPRTRPPAEIFSKKAGLRSAKSVGAPGIGGLDSAKTRPTTDIPNMLTSYARDHTVPGVFNDAEEGRQGQTNAHFKFGSCEDGVNSVYGKDFMMSAMATRSVPPKAFTKDAGNIRQRDPEFSNAARSLKSSDFMAMPRPLQKMSDANAGVKYVDHVNISLDPSRHTGDRQKSVAHSDYNKHPINYHALPPFMAKAAPYRYLETDNALPYPGLNRASESENNFIGSFMQGIYALDRRRQKEDACQTRASNTKSTHFVVGYAPGSFTSESLHQYQGRKKNDAHIPAAGKTEVRRESEFIHLGHSQNAQDLHHNDPHVTNKMEGLRARHLHEPAKGGNPFETSVMKEDYRTLNQRSLSNSQARMIIQDRKLASKAIETSHLFHTDNSGTNQYRSMTMHDFIKPEESKGGRKFLAAR